MEDKAQELKIETITFQVTQSEKIPFLMELLSHFDFIENVEIREETKQEEQSEEIQDETLTEEQKTILQHRLETLKNDTSDESEQESSLVKQRIREKLNRKEDVV